MSENFLNSDIPRCPLERLLWTAFGGFVSGIVLLQQSLFLWATYSAWGPYSAAGCLTHALLLLFCLNLIRKWLGDVFRLYEYVIRPIQRPSDWLDSSMDYLFRNKVFFD